MSAIARYFNQRSIQVSGYDKTPSAITDALIQEGINVYFEDDLSKVNDKAELVVYTPAIPKSSILLNYYESHQLLL